MQGHEILWQRHTGLVVTAKFPFEETKTAPNVRRRKFSSSANDEELTWHRDREDRQVLVVESLGWFLQMDDELPVELIPGGVHLIKKNTWHRVIKRRACSDLIVEITLP